MIAQDRSGSLRITQDQSGSLILLQVLLCLLAMLVHSHGFPFRSSSLRISQNLSESVKFAQDHSRWLRIAQVATTRFKSGFATPHASGQLLQLHTFQVRTCNSTRLRPPCSSTCLMSAFATPHVSGQPLQLHSFQINHCNSTCFRSALATPHI